MSIEPPDRRLVVYVVDDDPAFADSVEAMLSAEDFTVATMNSGEALLESLPRIDQGCALVDLRMPGLSGLELIEAMRRRGSTLPVIVMTGQGDVPTAVRAMKAGALDFVEKPLDKDQLLRSLRLGFEHCLRDRSRGDASRHFLERLSHLTEREREVFDRMLWAKANKVIAHELNISPRTVEIHRARVLQKMEADNVSDLIRAAARADVIPESEST
ncbi:MAG: response regulator transcription factor [Alphaproteobacteria bacterium]|nr:response regulator transcription factor [Alphaproteobacteria bacterium]